MSETLETVANKDAAETKKLAEQLLAQAKEQGIDLVGPGGLLNQLTKTVLETTLGAEMTEHVGHEKTRSRRPRNRELSHVVPGRSGGVQVVVVVACQSRRQAPAQGQCVGSCSTGLRCVRAKRAGTAMILRRRVAPRALPRAGSASAPAARRDCARSLRTRPTRNSRLASFDEAYPEHRAIAHILGEADDLLIVSPFIVAEADYILSSRLAADAARAFQLYDQQANVPLGIVPLLQVDMWEHAYYLQHKNVKADYVKAFWNVVNWADVLDRFAHATANIKAINAGFRPEYSETNGGR